MDLVQEREIRKCHRELIGVEGHVAEIGVYRGESAELITGLFEESDVHLFDTFEGMPKRMVMDEYDHHQPGDFGGSDILLAVRQRLERYMNQIKIHAGIFPDTAAGLEPRLKFVHIDADLYKSTRSALIWAWPLLVERGIILDDDYGVDSCRGAKKAIDDFVASTPLATLQKYDRFAIIRRHVL